MASIYANLLEQKKAFTWEKSSTPRGFSGYTNMAAVSLYGRYDVMWKRSIYFRLSGSQSSLLLIYFRYGPSTWLHCTKVWHRTNPICDDPHSRSARRSFVPQQKSRRNLRYYVWSSIWFAFRVGVIAIRYSEHSWRKFWIKPAWILVWPE